MRFYSPNANLQIICSKTLNKRHPVTGDIVETIPAIWANFGKLGPERESDDGFGGVVQGAEIYGHYYDTDIEAERNGWDADTKAMVERQILKICKSQPDRCQLLEDVIVQAPLPWPTFDAMEAEDAVAMAKVLGLTVEALAYERENRQRPYVIQGLQETPEPDEPPEPSEPEPELAASGKPSATITL